MQSKLSSDPQKGRTSRETTSRADHWDTCQKNPDHEGFIPRKDFNISHLPKDHKDEETVKAISVLADLTTRVIVKHVSGKRGKDDPLYNLKGTDVSRSGSGSVYRVERCSGSKVIKILISTACHVVFDDLEAKTTIFDLFYDDETNTENVKKLLGNCVSKRDEEKDWCLVECLTNDLELADILESKLQEFSELSKEIEDKTSRNKSQLIAIASHPHGKAKMITIVEVDQSQISNFHPKVKGDAITYIIPDPDVVPGPKMVGDGQAEIAGVQVDVHLPDGSKQLSYITQMVATVKETKEILMGQGGYSTASSNAYNMLIQLPEDTIQRMADEEDASYYLNDLCNSLYLFFEEKPAC